MDTKKLVAIAIVVIIIVAASAAVLMTGSDDDKDRNVDASNYGLVYGNANGDCMIDQDDLDLVSKCIEDPALMKKYPLADANNDGMVTQEDYDLVQKMINKDSMTVKVIDCDGNIVDSNYPLKKVFIQGGTNTRVIVTALNLVENMVANTTNESSLSNILDKELVDARNSGKVLVLSSDATSDDQTKLSAIDFDAAILDDSGMTQGYGSEAFRSLYAVKGASCLNFNYDNPIASLQTIAILGILTGHEDLASKYVEYQEGIINKIKEKEGDLYGTTTVMTVVMTNSVSGTDKDYYAASQIAGGKNLADFEGNKKFPDGSDNTWLLDPKYNPDFIIHTSSVTFGKDVAAKTKSAISTNFCETAAFKAGDYYVINGVLPMPVRLAITAEILYEGCFEDGWSNSVFQQYVDDYMGGQFQVSDYKYVWDTEDLSA